MLREPVGVVPILDLYFRNEGSSTFPVIKHEDAQSTFLVRAHCAGCTFEPQVLAQHDLRC